MTNIEKLVLARKLLETNSFPTAAINVPDELILAVEALVKLGEVDSYSAWDSA